MLNTQRIEHCIASFRFTAISGFTDLEKGLNDFDGGVIRRSDAGQETHQGAIGCQIVVAVDQHITNLCNNLYANPVIFVGGAVGSLDDAATPEERAELEKCKPANDEPVTFFNWNTLHEVGHAVDDKHGFMDSNGKKKEYGGWTEHGMDISGIADKIAKKFSYDTAYVTEYMAHNKSAHVPPRPEDEACTDEEWESRRVQMEAFVDMASEPAQPWSSMATAKKLAIGGVVYQESYPNAWNSYLLSERAKGITGYQFRAPGEWFSELYAAYHSGKLKPNHPAVGWLSKL